MTTYKYKDINTSVDKDKTIIEDNGTAFYTEDKGTTALRLFVNWRGQPFNLNSTTMKASLDLLHSDGSIWLDEPIEVINYESGLIQYKIPNNVIAHAGNVRGKLFLKSTEESVHVANFDFTIKDSEVEDTIAKEISVNIVDDAVRRIVKENAIEILGDGFEQRLNTDVINHLESNPILFKGDTGEKGETGSQGIQGPKGDKGNTGLTGASGPQGSQGIQGLKGDKGDIGLKGATGPQGEVGDKGEAGNDGLPGVKGDKGDKGDVGPKGDKGEQITYRDITLLNDLPVRFPGYDDLVVSSGNGYYYPQGLALDDTYIYVLFSPSGSPSGDMKRLIVVYDKITSEIVTKFYAGSAGGESIHVEVEGVSTFLYTKSKTSTLGKYDITNLPVDMTVLSPVKEYNIGLYYNFTKNNNEWIVEQDSETIKNSVTRELFAVYDADLTKVNRYFIIDPTVGGYWSSDLNYDTPKRQGIVTHNGNLLQIVGGNYYIGNDYTTYRAQGVQQLDSSGDIAVNYTYNPNELAELLTDKGHDVTRIEHESGFVYNGAIYALVVYNFEVPNTNGIDHKFMLVKYGDENFDKTMGENSEIITTNNNQVVMRPVNNGLVNDINGTTIQSIKELIKYMYDTNRAQVLFYTSNVSVKDENDEVLENGITVKIESAVSGIYWIEYMQNRQSKKVQVNYTESTNTYSIYKQNLEPSRSGSDLNLVKETANFYVTNSTNGPGGSAHGFVESHHTGSNGQQIFRPYNSAVRSFRYDKGGVWSEWVTL